MAGIENEPYHPSHRRLCTATKRLRLIILRLTHPKHVFWFLNRYISGAVIKTVDQSNIHMSLPGVANQTSPL